MVHTGKQNKLEGAYLSKWWHNPLLFPLPELSKSPFTCLLSVYWLFFFTVCYREAKSIDKVQNLFPENNFNILSKFSESLTVTLEINLPYPSMKITSNEDWNQQNFNKPVIGSGSTTGGAGGIDMLKLYTSKLFIKQRLHWCCHDYEKESFLWAWEIMIRSIPIYKFFKCYQEAMGSGCKHDDPQPSFLLFNNYLKKQKNVPHFPHHPWELGAWGICTNNQIWAEYVCLVSICSKIRVSGWPPYSDPPRIPTWSLGRTTK